MAHDLEQYTDGSASFFSARVDPWHRLGVVTSDCLTAEDAIKTARLDWEVSKQPLQTVINGTTTLGVPDRFAIVRPNPDPDPFQQITEPWQVLGVVGADYVPIQNWENAEFLNSLIDQSGAHFETAGSLAQGKRIFITMKVPNHITIGGHDRIDEYLVITNSHDGSTALQVIITPIRVVCANTLGMALGRNSGTIKLRHTTNIREHIEQARRTLKISNTYMAEFEEMANQLNSTPMTWPEFAEFADAVFPPQADPKKSTTTTGQIVLTHASQLRRDELRLLWKSDTQANIAGTRWAALNVIGEYSDHFAPVRVTADLKDTARAERVALGSMVVQAPKAKALALLTSA